jgi:cytochrome P450
MQRAVLDVALQVFLGSQLSDAELGKMQQAFSTQIEWLTKESLNPTDISLSKLPGMGELRQAYKTLNGVDRLIQERQASPTRPQDMLTGLIEAVDPSTGKPMDGERLRHEVLSLLEAGHETTATLMGWSLLMLARHPEEYTRLQKEIDQKVGSRIPTFKELNGLKQADNVTDESLRLYPPFYLFMREAKQDMTVGPAENPVHIEKGTTLVTNLYVTNRDEQIWGTDSTGYPANEFHPDRYNGDTPNSAPFGAGKRSCIGQALGRLENNLLMCRFAQTFDMTATSHEPIQLGSDLSIHSHAETVKIRLRNS